MNQFISKDAICIINLRGLLCYFTVIERHYIWAEQKTISMERKTVWETKTHVDAHIYTPTPYKNSWHCWSVARIHRAMECGGKRNRLWSNHSGCIIWLSFLGRAPFDFWWHGTFKWEMSALYDLLKHAYNSLLEAWFMDLCLVCALSQSGTSMGMSDWWF